jgi:hypothetical protein
VKRKWGNRGVEQAECDKVWVNCTIGETIMSEPREQGSSEPRKLMERSNEETEGEAYTCDRQLSVDERRQGYTKSQCDINMMAWCYYTSFTILHNSVKLCQLLFINR